jgi:hypothetical protein
MAGGWKRTCIIFSVPKTPIYEKQRMVLLIHFYEDAAAPAYGKRARHNGRFTSTPARYTPIIKQDVTDSARIIMSSHCYVEGNPASILTQRWTVQILIPAGKRVSDLIDEKRIRFKEFSGSSVV